MNDYPMDDELYHHGIKGQRWGVQNGPPYPLDSELSRKIKAKVDRLKENPIKKQDDDTFSIELNEDQKKAIKIGAYVIAGLYLECKYNTFSGTVTAIATAIESDPSLGYQGHAEGELPPYLSKTRAYIDRRNKGSNFDPKTKLYKIEGEHTANDDLRAVNKDFSALNSKTNQNCGLCSTAFEMRRRGYDVAAGFSDSGMTSKDISSSFRGAKEKSRSGGIIGLISRAGEPIDETTSVKIVNSFSKEKSTRGIMFVQWGYGAGGHAINYEVNSSGDLIIYDSQVRKTYKGNDAVRFLMQTTSCSTFRLDNLKENTDYMKKHNLIL